MSIPAIEPLLAAPFGDYAGIIRSWADVRGGAPALSDDDGTLNWTDLGDRIDRIAAALQRDGLEPGQAVAILGTTNTAYALAYLGTLHAGGCPAPLTTSATAAQLGAMLADSGAMHLFLDAAKADDLAGQALPPVRRVGLGSQHRGIPAMADWMEPAGATPAHRQPAEHDPFNIIYSSGTTGTPKGIVHPHIMRWRQSVEGAAPLYGHDPDVIRTLLSTPLYSNTTLASFLPTMVRGGHARLMGKFDAGQWLSHAAALRVTHTMLVPVQYQRLLRHPNFDTTDLSTMQVKFCTSAPFSAALKAETLARFPGALIEYYGLTEGGVVCVLIANKFPDKLHTVGQPVPGHELIVLNDDDEVLPPGAKGILTGRSPATMSGYRNQPEKTAEMLWHDENGGVWLKTGDIGIIDADGFVEIVGRAKDMIISGGFNVYPADLELELMKEPGIAEAAVVGMPSEQWGETPVAFVTAASGTVPDPAAVLATVNARLGKTQRLSAVHVIDAMPRSHIGKLLKTELRARLS